MSEARRYLVVDDNLAFAENLAEILREQGHAASIAGSADEALVLVRAQQFDALITDMRMPKQGGAAFLQEARRADPELPAIVVSAWTDEEDLRAATASGLLAILPKPVPMERLLELLSTANRNAPAARLAHLQLPRGAP